MLMYDKNIYVCAHVVAYEDVKVQTNMTYQPFRHIQHHNMITHISSHVYKLSGWRKIVLNFWDGILIGFSCTCYDFLDKFVYSTTFNEFMYACNSQSFYPEEQTEFF